MNHSMSVDKKRISVYQRKLAMPLEQKSSLAPFPLGRPPEGEQDCPAKARSWTGESS